MYFDTQSGLKIKEVISTPQGVISTSYTDYKEFDGIMMPVGMKQSMGPQSFDMNVKSVEINKGIDDSEFKI